ncbi:MAG: hypothetical protein JST72_08295 [Bacteroidetes bacterium]|nr:hypothetical protein [Bacteroidota bacterium]
MNKEQSVWLALHKVNEIYKHSCNIPAGTQFPAWRRCWEGMYRMNKEQSVWWALHKVNEIYKHTRNVPAGTQFPAWRRCWEGRA